MRIPLKYIYLIVFITVAYLMLPVMNGDYLYTIQDNCIFINGHTFMMDIVTHKGGWIMWASCYLTQFFYHPWLGSTILILLWTAIYGATILMLGIKDKWSPLALIIPCILLYHLLDYGYWIYYAKIPGLPFQPTLLVLICILFTWGVLLLTRPFKVRWDTKRGIACGLLLLLLAISHWLWPTSAWHYNYRFCHSIKTTLFDKNFKHELRMYRALDEFRFDDVLGEMPKDGKDSPTNLMVLYKNIALMHTGQIDKMFETGNCGVKPQPNDSLQIRTSQLGGPLVYYMFGQMNYSNRWAIENSVKYGLSFRNLKMMARTALFNQEFEAAAKYLAMLKNSIFHRRWALEHEAWMLNSTNFYQSVEYQKLSPLLNDDENTLNGDNGLCEKFLLEHFSDLIHANSPLLEDVIMCMSLWAKDYYAFCIHFYNYVTNHPDAPIPALYQEGAILLGNAEESPITLNGFQFDIPIREKYKQFVQDYYQLRQQGIDEQEMGRRLKPLFGSTYWWYYYFYNDFDIY